MHMSFAPKHIGQKIAETIARISIVASRMPGIVIGMIVFMQTAHGETLEQAWSSALATDHRVQAGHYDTEATEGTLQAALATRWPSLALQGGYTHLNEPPTAVGGISLPSPLPPVQLDFALPLQQPNFYSYKAEVTLPLYTSGAITQGIAAANSAVAAARHEELRTALDVKLAVAQAYVSSLRAARYVAVAQSNVESLTSFAQDVDNLFNQGVVARSDTLTARVALADARQRLIMASNVLDLVHADYNRLLGRSFTQNVELDELPLPSPPKDVDILTARAQELRPEIKTLEDQGKALHAQAASVRAGNGPKVALVGDYGRQQNIYELHDVIASVSVGIKWNIFDGGLVSGQAAALAAQAESVNAMREEARSLIALQVRQAWLNAQETAKRIDVAQAAVESADENLRLARDRYSQGLANNTEVLQAETLRTISQTNLHAATYDALMAQLQLKRATGEL
jgi:outer membrane protein